MSSEKIKKLKNSYNYDYANRVLDGTTYFVTSARSSYSRNRAMAGYKGAPWGFEGQWLDYVRDGLVTKIDKSSVYVYNENYYETRPKTKFYNLLIYAGYPIK